MLFETTFVMPAPHCKKDLDVYDSFISSVTNILREGRRGGAREFHIGGDLNGGLGLLCTDEEDIEELNEMYGPLCWQVCERDHSGFKQLMWYGLVKDFNCKGTSNGFRAPAIWKKKGNDREAQLDYFIGPRWKSDEAHIYNDVTIWDSWYSFQIYAVIQEYEASNYFIARRRTKLTGWRTKNDKTKIEFQKAVMRKEGEKQEENLGTIQKDFEEAPGKVAYSTTYD